VNTFLLANAPLTPPASPSSSPPSSPPPSPPEAASETPSQDQSPAQAPAQAPTQGAPQTSADTPPEAGAGAAIDSTVEPGGLWAGDASIALVLALILLIVAATVGAAMLLGIHKRLRMSPSERAGLRKQSNLAPALHGIAGGLGLVLLAFAAWNGFSGYERTVWPIVAFVWFLAVAAGGATTFVLASRHHRLFTPVALAHGVGALLGILLVGGIVVYLLRIDAPPPNNPADAVVNAVRDEPSPDEPRPDESREEAPTPAELPPQGSPAGARESSDVEQPSGADRPEQ